MIDLTFTTGKDFKEKIDNIMNEQIDRVIDLSKGVIHTKEYKKMLNTMAMFHHYSWHNSMLIWLQCPEASYVAGFRKWLTMKRYVRKGEKGIAILAPMFKNLIKIGEDGTDLSEKALVGFRKVYVFDVSQTDGEELDVHEIHKYVKDRNLKDTLHNMMDHISKQVPIQFYKSTSKEGGYCSKDSININQRICNSNTKVMITLLHEYTHWVLDFQEGTGRSDNPPDLKEMIAASVPYIIMKTLGIKGKDLDTDMALYVNNWSGNEEDKYKLLRDSMESMSKVVRRVLEWQL
jgi:antirestriction protein ArdC